MRKAILYISLLLSLAAQASHGSKSGKHKSTGKSTPVSSSHKKQRKSGKSTAKHQTRSSHQPKPITDPSLLVLASPSETRSANTENTGSTGEGQIEPAPTETASALQFKYAIKLDMEVESLPQTVLLEKLDGLYGTRYQMGGLSRKGIDCSGFTSYIYASVYGIEIPRISGDQYLFVKHIPMEDLREGDLVFFRTQPHKFVSHVGVYIGNDRFAHASVKQGVTISSLTGDPYYRDHFVGAGRIESKMNADLRTGGNFQVASSELISNQ